MKIIMFILLLMFIAIINFVIATLLKTIAIKYLLNEDGGVAYHSKLESVCNWWVFTLPMFIVYAFGVYFPNKIFNKLFKVGCV